MYRIVQRQSKRGRLLRLIEIIYTGSLQNIYWFYERKEILKHELMPVPIPIAETSGSLKPGNKGIIFEDILKDIDVRKRVKFGHACDVHLRRLSNDECIVQHRVMGFIA